MGMNNEHAHIVGKPWMVFDIETCPMPNCRDYLTDPIEAPSNWKDQIKINQYIEEKRLKQINEAGLDLDLCEIAAIAWALPPVNGQPECTYVQMRNEWSEGDLLESFWRFVAGLQREGGNLVGFNILTFDLPILLRRSLYLGVPTPTLNIDKYRHDGIVDVAHELTFGGRTTWRSLSFYAKRFGIPHDDSVDGSQIAHLVATQQWDEIGAHVKSDVWTTKQLAQRCGFIYQPQVEKVPELAEAEVF